MQHRPRAKQRSEWGSALLLVGLVFGGLAAGLHDGRAQTSADPAATPAPATEGFRLVARMLPAEWAGLVGIAATPAVAPASASPRTDHAGEEQFAGAPLVDALRRGGYVIYFRHAATDFSQPDADRENLQNCATQRNLDARGLADAMAIGAGFRMLGIPVGAVLSSEYCRTRETAELAFGRVTLTRALTSRANAPDDERARRRDALRCLLATPPAPGTNTVLVGHNFNLQDATGLSFAEGEAGIFEPQAGTGC